MENIKRKCWQCGSTDIVTDTGIRLWCKKCSEEAKLTKVEIEITPSFGFKDIRNNPLDEGEGGTW